MARGFVELLRRFYTSVTYFKGELKIFLCGLCVGLKFFADFKKVRGLFGE